MSDVQAVEVADRQHRALRRSFERSRASYHSQGLLASAPVGVLARYLLGRFLALFAAVLAILALLVALVELLADFGDVARASDGFGGALLLVALRVPYEHLPLLFPIAAFVAAFLCAGTAARSNEILAMKAGGVSPLRVLAPVIACAALISGLALLVNETIAVRAREAERRLAGGEDAELSFRRGSFWYHKDHTIYNVRDADPTTRVLRDVAVFDLDDRGRLVRSIRAAQATIGEDGRWQLSDAVLRSFQPDDASAPATYQRLAETEIELPEEKALLHAGVEDLSIRELAEVRDDRDPDDTASLRATTLLHERASAPFAAFVFVLFAVPLGLRVERTRSMALPALYGVVAIFLYLMVRRYGATLATQGVLSAVATPWVILAAFLALGAIALWRVPR
jgi:LPS export ABC transporter permease LptG